MFISVYILWSVMLEKRQNIPISACWPVKVNLEICEDKSTDSNAHDP